MTSNSVESVNALSRDERKLSITMLIDFFRATMQQWWCQRRNVGVIIVLQFTMNDKLKEKKMSLSMMRRSSLGGSTNHLDFRHTRLIKADMSRHYTYGKWQLSSIPFTHAMAVFKEPRYQHCSAWVSSDFIMETYHSTYIEVLSHVSVPSEYVESDQVMIVLPPLMDKRQVERPKNHNRIPSQGEGPIQKKKLVVAK
uniref:Uncharacterized protein n=1 Tax=Lactuca sativa TaxID=4236 RepID=A0A9R1VQG7_LACSA|nr:hypothetical protein LSAT_V11C400189950 [Lactuca sativa]